MDEKQHLMLYCFDPGLTVGCASFSIDALDYKANLLTASQIEHTDLDSFMRFINFVNVNVFNPAVVYEGFARGNTVVDEQIKTIEMCGTLRALAFASGINTIDMQVPAKRKGYLAMARVMADEKLNIKGHDLRHCVDAIAHGICWLEDHKYDWNKDYWIRKVVQKYDR